jgi:hypothetical protein
VSCLNFYIFVPGYLNLNFNIMKIKYGALIVDGRNKIGGHVASRNRAGAFLRTKVTPINPGTTYQVNARNRFGGLSSAWRGLDAGEILAWNAAVSDYARTDIFGDLRNPSGFNLHQKLNNNLINIGESAITTPPLPEAVDAFNSLSIVANVTTPAINITFDPVIADTHKVFVFATPGISPGISFVKSAFRLIMVLSVASPPGFTILGPYVSKFSAVPVAGSKVFVRLVQVNVTTGQAGIPIQASTIVVA